MQELISWIIANWEPVTAVIVGSGTTGILTKRAIDKTQDTKIKEIEGAIEQIRNRLEEMDTAIQTLENDIKMNTNNDSHGRELVTNMLIEIKANQSKMEQLLMEILTGKIKLK